MFDELFMETLCSRDTLALFFLVANLASLRMSWNASLFSWKRESVGREYNAAWISDSVYVVRSIYRSAQFRPRVSHSGARLIRAFILQRSLSGRDWWSVGKEIARATRKDGYRVSVVDCVNIFTRFSFNIYPRGTAISFTCLIVEFRISLLISKPEHICPDFSVSSCINIHWHESKLFWHRLNDTRAKLRVRFSRRDLKKWQKGWILFRRAVYTRIGANVTLIKSEPNFHFHANILAQMACQFPPLHLWDVKARLAVSNRELTASPPSVDGVGKYWR